MRMDSEIHSECHGSSWAPRCSIHHSQSQRVQKLNRHKVRKKSQASGLIQQMQSVLPRSHNKGKADACALMHRDHGSSQAKR
ncbi:hypothetical protein DUNSADRAFT_4693 [Dunaliella salina]|uniref:Encoded protein n=1 Tax=Dunaliella salina TaxID=3046 RepID=A0ABQ7H7H5_DUNSA|nr:hypothetical protein DUNSADRAFT_4693 [Dunaliella salina]|eukprot:KAF5842809.1 hypothetical protein DUNSADRAFT_4693 [Dunaliella salina]